MTGTRSFASFQTRARAVDMLGRQQIAGIPTAISELFKNAHDAYADTVEVDFFRSDQLFVIRDNGVGMTYDEFVNNWLTLATDAKVTGMNDSRLLRVPVGKKPRTISGAKGIGRLAIAAIGPQVLVLTQTAQQIGDGRLVVAFINWNLFRLPGINLNEIRVPILTFPHSTALSTKDLDAMISNVRELLKTLGPRTNQEMIKNIHKQLDQFQCSDRVSSDWDRFLFGNLEQGTAFYIQPTDQTLESDIDDSEGVYDTAPPLIKMLLGFTNTMTPGHSKPVIHTAFRDHKTSNLVEDLIGDQEFFTPDEFESADHHIRGRFDEFGQFLGTVKIYGQEPVTHTVPWRRARGLKTQCGPFELNMAVVQGKQQSSRLPSDDWGRIVSKLNRIGGLYIYRDGIRILPYGSTDYDFLDIERNRTKSAGYYYFSYRRIFGAIEIDQTHNGRLVEKAGREGFIENHAYRQFRQLLKSFLAQITADFFRKEGIHTEVFEDRKIEIERQTRIIRRRENAATAKRLKFQESLEGFFRKLDDGLPQKHVTELLENLESEMQSLDNNRDPDKHVAELIAAEQRSRHALKRIKQELQVSKPRGVGLSRATRRDWDAYRREMYGLVESCIEPAEVAIDSLVQGHMNQSRILVDRRVRLEAAVEESVSDARGQVRTLFTETRKSGERLAADIDRTTREARANMEATLRQVRTEVARLNLSGGKASEFEAKRTDYIEIIERAAEKALDEMASVREQVQEISWGQENGDNFTQLDLLEVTESELLDVRERADLDLEMTQLGAAIEVINHEFDASIRSVRSSLRQLKAWADVNPILMDLHNELRASFDHLDGYLTLFTPLQRRLYRKKVEIHGSDISRYVSDLFQDRVKRHEVELRSTKSFDQHVLWGYPSTFYPVFVNLIDNALFWLSDMPQPRAVILDLQDCALVVSDSGPGIPKRDWDLIFELGFTRKPNGRGLGLYIVREVLRRVNYTIDVASKGPLKGATFHIRKQGDDRV